MAPLLLLLLPLHMVILAVAPPGATAQHFHHKPKPSDIARTARWLAHESTWGVISTLSTITGAPFGNPQSFVDGPYGGLFGNNATGIPYFYVSEMDVSQIDVAANPDGLVALTMSEAILPGGCKNTDPESPLCVRLTITGRLIEVADGSEEREWAIQALFDRHPAMAGWPADHSWVVKKLVPAHVFILDMFGGAKPLSVEDYMAVEL